MNELISESIQSDWNVWIIFVILFWIVLSFFWNFVFPGLRLRRELRTSIAELGRIKAESKGPVTDLDDLAKKATVSASIAHQWTEYAKTLHPQKEVDDQGQMRVRRWRATTLAESFFTDQALVDTRLKVDFYKHIPGILTGLGIIGTFTGLILGLDQFQVSSNPAVAQDALGKLIKAVGHAFIVSGIAIVLAMVFTGIEKSLLTSCYRLVEQLRQAIDSLFDSGVDEEYLERMVNASETAATQAIQIKDSLVADLKQMLSEVSAQQIEAAARNSSQMTADLGKAIADSLGAPMARISNAVERVGSDQGDAVSKLLTDVLQSFSSQMQDMFGGQLRGMSDLLVQTNQAMQATAAKFDQLAGNMDSAGKSAVDAMKERLNHAITSMEARQGILNKQMGEFVEQIRASVSQSQSDSSNKMQETLAKLGEQVVGVVAQLQDQAKSAAASHQAHSEAIATNAGNAVNGLSTQVEALISQSTESNRLLQASVASLSAATSEAIRGLNSGAETLYIAATDFAKAGQGVSETMVAASSATEKIQGAAHMLSASTASAQHMIEDYTRTSNVFASMVSDLKATIDLAKREASMTTELISKLQSATAQLALAQQQSEDYLKGVTEVLTQAHESFAENVERTMRLGNSQFHKELAGAVDLFSGSIKDLGDTLDDFNSRS